MRLKVGLACAVGVLAAPMIAGAAPGTVKVTGGGQSLTDGKDTIGFNAQRSSTGAVKGQVQYVDRAQDGSTQTQYHGTVTCFTQIGDNAAFLGGTWRHANGDPAEDGTGFFRLYVEDNGEPNQGADMIAMNSAAPDPSCDEDDHDEDTEVSLARGNVQFHSASGGRKRSSAAKRVSLAGLR